MEELEKTKDETHIEQMIEDEVRMKVDRAMASQNEESLLNKNHTQELERQLQALTNEYAVLSQDFQATKSKAREMLIQKEEEI